MRLMNTAGYSAVCFQGLHYHPVFPDIDNVAIDIFKMFTHFSYSFFRVNSYDSNY